MPRFFYGWCIVAGAFMLQALGNALYMNSFGAYFVHLQEEFGWSRTLISGAYSLTRLETGFLSPFQGWLITRLGPRTVLRIGLFVFSIGLFFFASIDAVPGYYVAILVIATGAALAGFFTVNIVLVNWFERRRARAMSLAATGQSVGGLLVPAVVLALSTFGWRTTAIVSGILVLVIGLPVAQLFRPSPEAAGLLPDGVRARPVAETSSRGSARAVPSEPWGISAREALHTPSFWMLSLGHSFALVAITALQVHLIPYLVDRDMTLEAAAGIAALVTGMSFVGQLFGGMLGDRFDKRLVAAACMVGHTVALLLLVVGSSMILVFAFAILQGLAWGIRGPLMMAIRAEYFGRRSFATIEGFAGIITTLGSVTGPVLTGFLADTLGDYRVAFLILAMVTGVGELFFALAKKPAIAIERALELA